MVKFYAQLDAFDKRPEAAGIVCKEASLAVQSQRDESDINVIVSRFLKTGVLPSVAVPPSFMDVTEPLTFQEANNLVIEANRSFMQLPAEVRASFGHDPGAFVEYVEDRKPDGSRRNLDKLREWNLALPELKVEPDPVTLVRVVSDDKPGEKPK